MRHLWLLLAVSTWGCGSSGNSNLDFSHPADLAIPVDMAGEAGQPCDAYKQTGCGAGLHCTVGVAYDRDMKSDSPTDICIPNPPIQIPEGGKCAPIDFLGYGGDLCEPGTACMAYGGFYKCRKLCFRHKDCNNNDTCVVPSGSPESIKDSFGDDIFLSGCLHSENCDPVMKTGCPIPGQACYFSGADDIGRATLCEVQLANRSPGADCGAGRQCGAGEMCAGLGFCRRLCLIEPVTVDGGTKGACPWQEGVCDPFFGSLGVYGICE